MEASLVKVMLSILLNSEGRWSEYTHVSWRACFLCPWHVPVGCVQVVDMSGANLPHPFPIVSSSRKNSSRLSAIRHDLPQPAGFHGDSELYRVA